MMTSARPAFDAETSDLWRNSATDLARDLKLGKISARDLTESSLEQIDRHEGWLRAFITLAGEQALEAADQADRVFKEGRAVGPLHGLPVAIKDVTATAGIRTTYGSRIYADNVPAVDDAPVRRLREAGAIIIGKTNTPEFGFGPRCVNSLAGPTATPYDRARSSGGSSGGSAASVSMGMVPLAHGTDFGGSVRTPASFCGVVGLRPTPGLIADPGRSLAWDTFASHGILARSVEDAELMLAVLIGRDDRDPTSRATPDSPREPSAIRLGVSGDLGVATIARDVMAVFDDAVARVATLFPMMDDRAPDCTGGQDAFETLRAAIVWRVQRKHWGDRNLLTDPARWNIERGEGISADEFLRAEEQRGIIYRNFINFFEEHDFLITPSASVLPFPNTQSEVLEIDGELLRNPLDYLTITYLISLVGLPCLSIPCGWTTDGLPVGMQIVGPPLSESRLLSFARQLQDRLEFKHRWPV